MRRVFLFLKAHAVLVAAVVAAVITCFFVPPDREYVGYFDFPTLGCLFATLAVVCALGDIRFFEMLAKKIVVRFKNTRNIVFALVFITYFGSMILANDMALITFLPLGYFALSRTGKEKYMAFTFVMQNVAANLGGMLTPFGNPQNLYLYSYFRIPGGEFFAIMLPTFLVALVLIVLCCFFVKKEPAELTDDVPFAPNPRRLFCYLALFVLSVLSVMRVYPWYIGVGIALIGVAALDVKDYRSVNYSLLLTFCAFFVFSGNLSRISAVHELIGSLLNKNVLLFSVLSCQVISNVPTATLLCRFTNSYPALLVGVNVGGLGTPIASLASLITLGSYRAQGGKTGKYLLLFSAINFSFVVVLCLTGYLFLYIV